MESALVALALLACPVGMGLMMWFMRRGMKRGERSRTPTGDGSSLAELRSEQARMAAEIERLEADRPRDGDPARR